MLTSKIDIGKILQGVPVLLFFKGSYPGQANNIFMTNYYLIKKIDEARGCAIIMPLRKCKVCADESVLEPTDNYILIDIKSICSYQLLPNACVRKCTHPPVQFQDSFCGPFAFLPGNEELLLWQSNFIGTRHGHIHIEMEKGTKDCLELRMYKKFTHEYQSYLLVDNQTYDFNIINCSSITLFKLDINAKVSGHFEIHLINEIENS